MTLQYWRSTSQFEVDLIIGGLTAVEVKATNLAQDKHLKGLRALGEEGIMSRRICVSLDSARRVTTDGIEIWPWREFVAELWAGGVF
jgi:predicted AAA+ superfamily ATPase